MKWWQCDDCGAQFRVPAIAGKAAMACPECWGSNIRPSTGPITDREVARYVVKRLEGELKDYMPPKTGDSFRGLIGTVLSQQTHWKNVKRAMEELEKRVGLTPEAIANADLRVIEECLKPAGLHRVKAPRIQKIAQIVTSMPSLLDVSGLTYEEAKKRLMENFPGVGEKTADVWLSWEGFPAFAVDTHIFRITRRLGLADESASYAEVQKVWTDALPPSEWMKAHYLLVAFGRERCKALNPRCVGCPIGDMCEHREALLREEERQFEEWMAMCENCEYVRAPKVEGIPAPLPNCAHPKNKSKVCHHLDCPRVFRWIENDPDLKLR